MKNSLINQARKWALMLLPEHAADSNPKRYMRKHKLLFLVGGGLCGLCVTLLFAQTLPPDLPSRPRGGITTRTIPETARSISQLKGEQYISLLTVQEAKSGRAETSSPLPLSLDQAEEIARRELQKLVRDDFGWQFVELSVRRFRGTDEPIWYFAATLKTIPVFDETNSDSFTVLLNASGRPGRIGRFDSAGMR